MNLTIKEILARLPAQARTRLMYAFEQNIPQHVNLPNRRYIGVNTGNIRFLQPEQFAGSWTAGINLGPTDDVVELLEL